MKKEYVGIEMSCISMSCSIISFASAGEVDVLKGSIGNAQLRRFSCCRIHEDSWSGAIVVSKVVLPVLRWEGSPYDRETPTGYQEVDTLGH